MLKLRQKKNESDKEKEKEKESNDPLESQSYDTFYNVLFSLPDIQNILIDLDLKNSSNDINIPNSFELINKLKVLKNLTITGYKFQNSFILKLHDLKRLKLIKVQNLALDESSPFNLDYLYLSSCEMVESKSKINIPKLEKFYNLKSSNLYINYQNFKFLKIMGVDSSIFIKLTDIDLSSLTALEELKFFDCDKYETKIIKKLFLIKNLKIAEFHIDILTDEKIEKIEGEHLSLTTLRLAEVNSDCIAHGIQKLFPNVTSILVHSYKSIEDLSDHWCLNCRKAGYCIYPTRIEIKENRDCKVDTINLIGEGCRLIELYCQSYDSLKEITIEIDNRIIYIDIPIFKDKSDVVFKSLVNFTFINVSDTRYISINSDFIRSIYINIDNMPNLKTFIFICNIRNVRKEFYIELIKKLLSLNLDKITLLFEYNTPDPKKYSRQELIEIYPNINHLNFKKISIYKYI